VLLFVFSTKEYTALVLIVMGISAIADRVARVNLLAQRNYYIMTLLIIGLTTLFNGYLTLRPVVIYNELYLSGIRLGSIPIEDYGYGLVLIHSCLIIYERLRRRTDETG
jgi:lycopene cyclase domain-containing protein